MFKEGWLVVLVLLLSGCGQSLGDFKAKVDDQRSYWVYSQIDAEGGFRSVYQSAALQQYRISETSPLSMDVELQQLDVNYRNRITLNSFNGEASDDYLLPLFSQGFSLTREDTAKAAEVSAHNRAAWQQLQQQAPPLFLQTLQKTLLMPALLQHIPTQQGAQVALQSLAGVPMTLTVTHSNEQQLTAQLSSTESGPKVNGELVLDRTSGWLKSMVLVMDVPVAKEDKLAGRDHAHLRLALLPPEQAFDWQQLTADYIDVPIPILSRPDIDQLFAELPADTALSYDTGYFDDRKNQLLLAIPQQPQLQHLPLHFNLRNITAYNSAGDVIDIGWAPQYQAPTMLDRKSAVQVVLPYGWQKIPSMQAPSYIEADVDYLPAKVQQQTVTWQAGEQQFTVDGVTIHITPDANQNGDYQVSITTPSNKRLLPYYDGMRGEVVRFAEPDEDTWWHPKDQLLLNKITDPQLHRERWSLRHTPQQVTFYVETVADSAAGSRHIRFVPREEFLKDPHNPPYMDDSRYRHDGADSWQQVSKLQSIRAKINLLDVPYEWARVCEPLVVKTDKQFAVHWQPVSEPTDKAHFGRQRYQLLSSNSADAWRGQLEVTTRLKCNATAHWQALPYQPSDTSWLVPVSLFGKLDLQQPVHEFLQDYRFVNQQQALLSLVGTNGYALDFASDVPLASVLTADKQLRLSGYVAQIFRFKPLDKSTEFEWQQPLQLQ
ncbi:hypothetical protein [Shewanella sp.]|uniref:hypothetical protein n=1 Tax=Shewanella sp. TaxID=50422 RepID=UPI003A97BB3F